MLNLGVLDTAIAVVVVLLLLSLIVQSIQTFLKKLTRFKSQQIAKSLEKLFAEVAPQPATPAAGGPPAGGGGAAAAPKVPTPAEMTNKVLDYFKKLGRDSLFGGHALESLSKADLSKIVAAVQASHLLPEKAMTAVNDFYGEFSKVQGAVAVLTSVQLSADAQAKLAQLRAQIAPIEAQVAQLFANGKVDEKAVARDIFALRNLDTSAIVTTAAELQKSIEDAAAAANPANPILTQAAKDAAELAKIIANVNTHLVNATAQLKARLGSLESWFDTVMQGFEERYARHMRSWSFVIGLGVAIVMNANVVQLYTRFSGDDIQRQRVIAQGAVIQAKYTTAVTDTAQPATDLKKLVQDEQKELKENADTYTALGLKPITWDELKDIMKDPRSSNFWQSIIGWLIMAFLLSLGAPFWHDALESLFGVKNLLQQRGESKNIEQGAGQGNTQSS
jgi:hypothetical protein